MDDTKRLIGEIKKQLSEMSADERKEIEKPKVFRVNHFFCVLDGYWLRTPPLTEPVRNAAA